MRLVILLPINLCSLEISTMVDQTLEVVEHLVVRCLEHLKSVLQGSYEYELRVEEMYEILEQEKTKNFVLVEFQPSAQWFANCPQKYGWYPNFLIAVCLRDRTENPPMLECQFISLEGRYRGLLKSMFASLVRRKVVGLVRYT